MSSNRLSQSMSPAAMIVAVLALVLAGAGVGWSASQITTKDIKNNAVTSPKVKNGSLKDADLVKEKKVTLIADPGGPEPGDGGEGDCDWSSPGGVFGSADPSYRVDRFGMVHLYGVAYGADAAGGDADCDQANEDEDGLVTVLPPQLRPGANLFVAISGGGVLYVAGSQGLPGLAPGSVYVAGTTAPLDGISYYPSTSPLAAVSTIEVKQGPVPRAWLKGLPGH